MGKANMIIPELAHLVDPTIYELPEHTVTVSDFGEVDFQGKSGMRLGFNTGQDEKVEILVQYSRFPLLLCCGPSTNSQLFLDLEFGRKFLCHFFRIIDLNYNVYL